MHYSKVRCLLVIAVLSFLFSCKKKKDDIFGPTVTFTTPVPNQFYNVMTSITVKAKVTDDNSITRVSMCLVDAFNNPMHVTISLPVSSPTMNISAPYPLDNIHLESGAYSIMIIASDGTNETRTLQPIYLGAVPKVIKKVLVMSASSTAQTNMSAIDSTFSSLLPLHTFSGDYLASSASSYYQQAYVCGYYTGYFSAYNVIDNSIRFTVPPYLSSSPFFTGYCATERNTYFARYDGFIRGYDYTGNVIYNANAQPGFYAQHLCFNSGHLLAEEKDKTSSVKKLITFYPTGVAQQETLITLDVVDFCEKDAVNVFMFGNSNGQGVIQLFDRINNNVWNPYNYSLPPGTISSVAQIDNNTYLIAHSNGTIYKYEYQNSSMTTYLTGYVANKIKYDIVNNELYVVASNTISTFDYATKTFHHSVNSGETIADIQFLYNR